jgi:hypothetical protein
MLIGRIATNNLFQENCHNLQEHKDATGKIYMLGYITLEDIKIFIQNDCF